ncbi:MAG: hypothetical protein Q9223_006138 [Gallowayella weberi]
MRFSNSLVLCVASTLLLSLCSGKAIPQDHQHGPSTALTKRATSSPRSLDALLFERQDDSEKGRSLILSLEELEKQNAHCVAVAHMEPMEQPVSLDSVGIEKRVNKPADLLWSGNAIVVDMGAAIWHAWAGNPIPIGTFGLCGCTALVLANDVGAIVAHIRPNAGTINVDLQVIRNLFTANGMGTAARAILFQPATFGMVQQQGFQDQIANFLSQQLSVSLHREVYDTMPQTTNGRDGTLVVRQVGQLIKIWMNNKLVAWS